MLIFAEGGKPENPEKNPRSEDENQQQTQPTYDAGSGNRTRATLVGGECSHHCAIPAPTSQNSLRSCISPGLITGILRYTCTVNSRLADTPLLRTLTITDKIHIPSYRGLTGNDSRYISVANTDTKRSPKRVRCNES